MRACSRTLLWLIPFVALPAFSQNKPNADSLFYDGLRLFRAGEVSQSRQVFRNLLDHYPLYHDARVLYGRIISWEGHYRDAIAQFDSVLFHQPSHRDARFAKAQVYSWMGRYRSAADILLVLTSEDPKSALYWLQLANVYFWGKNPRRALEYYEAAYLRDPDSPDVLRGLARCHRALQSEALALAWYQKLLDRNPGDREALAEINKLAYRSTHEIQVLTSYESFVRGGFQEHIITQLSYFVALNEDWKPFVTAGRVSKFSTQENRFGGGVYGTIDYSIGIFAQLLISPGADVTPETDALAELTFPLGGGIDFLAEYRFMKFDTTNVHVPSPGLTFYVSDNAWLTMKGYFGVTSKKTSSTAFTLTAWYRSDPHATWRIGAFSGNESFRATSLQETISLRSSGGFLGLKRRISELLAVDVLYQFTSRSPSSNSHQAILSVSLLF